MDAQKKIDTKDLEHKIAALQKSLSFVNDGSGPNSNTLFQIIHRPGWTTILDVAAVAQILDSMNHQAAALNGLKDSFAKQVEAGVGR